MAAATHRSPLPKMEGGGQTKRGPSSNPWGRPVKIHRVTLGCPGVGAVTTRTEMVETKTETIKTETTTKKVEERTAKTIRTTEVTEIRGASKADPGPDWTFTASTPGGQHPTTFDSTCGGLVVPEYYPDMTPYPDMGFRGVVLPPFMQPLPPLFMLEGPTVSFGSDPPSSSLAPARDRLEVAIRENRVQTVMSWSEPLRPSAIVDSKRRKKQVNVTECASFAETQFPHPFAANKTQQQPAAKDADDFRRTFATPMLPGSPITICTNELGDRREGTEPESSAFAAVIGEKLRALVGRVFIGNKENQSLLSHACREIFLDLPRTGSAPSNACPTCRIYSDSNAYPIGGGKLCPACDQLIMSLYNYSSVFLAIVQAEAPGDPTVVDCLAIVINECFRYRPWSSSSRLLMHFRRVFMAAAYLLCNPTKGQ